MKNARASLLYKPTLSQSKQGEEYWFKDDGNKNDSKHRDKVVFGSQSNDHFVSGSTTNSSSSVVNCMNSVGSPTE